MDKKARRQMIDLLLLANDAIEAVNDKIRFDRSFNGIYLSNGADDTFMSIYPGQTYGQKFDEVEDYLNGLLKGEVAA